MNLTELFAGRPGAIFGLGYQDPTLVGIYCLALLILCVAIGMRVVFAVALIGMIGLTELIGFRPALGSIGQIPYSKSVSFVLGLIPMFILIGYLAFHAGMTRQLFHAAKVWIGWVPGGMAVATVFSAAGFAAVSGASVATTAVFARVAIPEMLKHGYERKLAAGVVAAGGTLASLIPPSAILVIYAIIVEESVGALLLAGFIPGILSALIYGAAIVLWAKMDPSLGPPVGGFGWGERIRSLGGVIPIAAVVVIIMSAMYFGWATPTEAGALGAFVVLVVAILNGMRLKGLKDALLETARLTAMIFALIWGVLIFARFLGFSGLPGAFAGWISGLEANPYLILLAILLAYVVLGMFLDAIGLLLLTLPVVYPAVIALNGGPFVSAADSAFGVSGAHVGIWFGIIVVKMAEVCLITPPIGLNCFVVNGIRPDIPLQDVFRGVLRFFVIDLLTIALIVFFPIIVIWLPDLMR